MIKQAIIYLLISIIIVIFATQIQTILLYINIIYNNVNIKLAPIFSSTYSGMVFRKTFSLLLLPLIITGLPAVTYRVIQGRAMPYLIEVTWIVWLTLVLASILIQ